MNKAKRYIRLEPVRRAAEVERNETSGKILSVSIQIDKMAQADRHAIKRAYKHLSQTHFCIWIRLYYLQLTHLQDCVYSQIVRA